MLDAAARSEARPPGARAEGKPRERPEAWSSMAIDAGDFRSYRDALIHEWLRTLTTLAVVLVPAFFALDTFMMPQTLLARFAVYRGASTILALVQVFIVRLTKPSGWSHLHGYFMSLQIGAMIALMTVDLGGFDSSYYAGLNLVIIGVNLLMPWKARHTAINFLMILAMYVGLNLVAGLPHSQFSVTNNMFFLISMGVLAVSINHVRYRLIEREFSLLLELKEARDSLWGEMELAKRIQTAILPQKPALTDYDVSVTMIPAKEVGGDYYDVIQTEGHDRWVAIGDVAGHGVDSGLIMMMAQTSLMTAIRGVDGIGPIQALSTLNRVLKEDIKRLGENHYMTMMVLRLGDKRISVAGHHQDFFVYRAATGKVEAFSTKGTWLGISEDIEPFLEVLEFGVETGDALMLFTDGATEGTDPSGEMFGQTRLMESFGRHASLPTQEALDKVLQDVRDFQASQEDDITLMVLKKGPKAGRENERAERKGEGADAPNLQSAPVR